MTARCKNQEDYKNWLFYQIRTQVLPCHEDGHGGHDGVGDADTQALHLQTHPAQTTVNQNSASFHILSNLSDII